MRALLFILAIPLCLVAIVVGLSTEDNKTQDVAAVREQLLLAIREQLAAEETVLQREQDLLDRGMGSQAMVDKALEDVCWSRRELALLDGDGDEAIRQMNRILEGRVQTLARHKQLVSRGVAPPEEMDLPGRKVATAQYLRARLRGEMEGVVTHLREVIEVCERELATASHLHARGLVSEGTVDSARRRLAHSKYLLAVELGESEEARGHLELAAKMRERELHRLLQLQAREAASAYEVDLSRLHYLRDQKRLTMVHGDYDAARKLMKDYITIYENLMKSDLSYCALTEAEQAQMRTELAGLRYRQALGEKDPIDLWLNPIWELDY